MENDLFGEMREFTKEESELHEKSIYEMFKPTGENINKFYDEYKPNYYFKSYEGYIPVINL